MRTIAMNCLPGAVKKTNLASPSLLTLICCMMALFLSFNVSAQTFPTSCTSKDLTLLKASLPAPAGNRCACSGDRSLILGIHNGTGSVRTSFALWGTLVRKDAAGNVVSSKSLFACAGPIPANGDYFLNASTIIIDGVPQTIPSGSTYPIIHIDCGESLDITNMHLAWTSATAGATCESLYNSPSTINPKCGTQDLIRVDLGVSSTLTNTNASCTAGGSIKVEPYGGIAPYQVCLYKKNSANDSTQISTCRNVAAGGSTTFTGLDAGTYTVKTWDNMNETDASKRCFLNKTATLTQPDAVTDPVVKVTDPSCTVSTGKIEITSTTTGLKFKLDNGNFEDYPAGGYTVASGNHTIVCQKGSCTSNSVPANVGAVPQSPTFKVCITQPTLCSKGSLTIYASGGTSFQYSINGGTTYSPATATTSPYTFNNLVTGDVTNVKVKNSDGCTSSSVSCADLGNYLDVSCGGSAGITQKQAPVKSTAIATIQDPVVNAYPNPFNDRVKFVVNAPAAGNGRLDIYNVMGQKIKTVYQGHINAGNNSFELTISKKQQQTLLYIFSVGDKKVTGKLLQLNN